MGGEGGVDTKKENPKKKTLHGILQRCLVKEVRVWWEANLN